MRRTAVLLAAVCLALAGCSSGGKGADAKPSASSSPTVDKAAQFLTAAHGITFNGAPSDDELLAYPPQWCDALASGHSVEWMFDMTGGGNLYPIGMEWGMAKADANELLLVGVKAYCPAEAATVTAELRAAGEY